MKHNINFFLKIEEVNIHYSVRFFKDYVTDVNKFVLNQQEKLDKRYKKIEEEVEAYDGEATFDAYDILADDIEQYYKFNPNLLHNSVLISIYSFFEVKLKEFCEEVNKYVKTEEALDKSPRGSIIDYYRSYLKGLCNFSKLDKEWQEIKQMQKLRNKIVHENASFPKKDLEVKSSVISLLKKIPEIEVDEKMLIFRIKDHTLLLHYCDAIENFFVEMCKMLLVKK